MFYTPSFLFFHFIYFVSTWELKSILFKPIQRNFSKSFVNFQYNRDSNGILHEIKKKFKFLYKLGIVSFNDDEQNKLKLRQIYYTKVITG